MTAAGLDYLSDGRAIRSRAPPVLRLLKDFTAYPIPLGGANCENRHLPSGLAQEKVQYMGDHYQIPLPQDRGTGLGKPLKLINHPVRADIPIAIASGAGQRSRHGGTRRCLAPRILYRGAAAVWANRCVKGNSKRADDQNRGYLRRRQRRYRRRNNRIGDRADREQLLYIGGMGARLEKFYNDIFSKSGYEAEAKIIQDLYLAGERKPPKRPYPMIIWRRVH